jgi:mono/diheme cytochrome c family protein
MKLAHWFLSICAVVGFSGHTWAQNIDVGKVEFESSCAPCHGTTGKGDGPVAGSMKAKPTDLTVLAKKNGGVFPFDSIFKIIDGREVVASHGTREMPIWGYRFVPRPKLVEGYVLAPAVSPEAIVQGRILAVIDYLNRIQAK